MLPKNLKNKVYKKLTNNKLNGITPKNVAELSKELGFTRSIFYYAFTDKFSYCPIVEEKIKNWVKNNNQ